MKKKEDGKLGFLMEILTKVILHPKLMLRVINLKRIKNAYKYFRLEGMKGVIARYQYTENTEKYFLDATDQDNFQLYDTKNKSCKEDYAPLVFNKTDDPLVSIIIQAYDPFNYTYACLQSVYENTKGIPYEIIIVNGPPADASVEVDKIIRNAALIIYEENGPSLLSCNRAAKDAKGKYLMFLNNNMQVQGGWLSALVNLAESDGTVGLAGSKLLYPDGRLQEAGRIVWKNALVAGYGYLCNGNEAEFNYVKEVDYVQGAAMMIRASLWNGIGGFDGHFGLMDYGAADLAFEVRKHDRRAVYQPLSVVVNVEEASKREENRKIESRKEDDRIRFGGKWQEVLEKESIGEDEDLFLARDRSRFQKHILVVDHHVPHYDKDAGGKCCYMYLKLFLKLGMRVTFIGDNYIKYEPYTTELEQMGIEVLYGVYYRNNWEKWLEENLRYFDYVYLQRPQISIKYINLMKKYSNAKVFYFAVDLHHVREYREYQLNKNPKLLESSREWRKMEYELFEKADVGHVVGSYEQGVMQTAFPGKPIRNIPLYIYENLLADIDKDFEKRRNIMFVGGFNHPPNIDAVLWFAKEIFPYVLKKYPDMQWHVVGSNPPLEIKELAGENILIEGFLSDDELQKLYRSCRLAVVPLRVGAGVKGKVVEAAYYQIPLITTSIGAEGLSREEGFMMIEEDALQLADMICKLYEDYSELGNMSNRGKEFIRKHFMLDEAERVLKLDL